jgi:hypothetical protein
MFSPAIQAAVGTRNTGAGSSPVTRSDGFSTAENPLATNWETFPGQAAMMATNGAASGTDASGSFAAFWDADVFSDNQFSQAKIYGANVGVAVKVSSAVDSFYLMKRTTGNIFQMWRVNASSWSQLGGNYSIAHTDGKVLRLEVSGTTLTPLYDGTTQASQSDTAVTGQRVGMMCESNYASGAYLDDWSGGEL